MSSGLSGLLSWKYSTAFWIFAMQARYSSSLPVGLKQKDPERWYIERFLFLLFKIHPLFQQVEVIVIEPVRQSKMKGQSLTPLWWSCRCLWPRGSNWWRGPCRTESCPRSPADAAGSLSVCGPGWWSSPAASGDSRTKTGWRPFRTRIQKWTQTLICGSDGSTRPRRLKTQRSISSFIISQHISGGWRAVLHNANSASISSVFWAETGNLGLKTKCWLGQKILYD